MGRYREDLKLDSPKLAVALWTLVALIFYLAVLPSLYLIVWAIAGTEVVGVINVGEPSTRWFWQVLSDPDWKRSIIYSTAVALTTSVIGCVILLIHFYSMRFAIALFDRIAYLSVLLIVLIPAVNYALALRATGGRLNMSEIVVLTLGHLITVLPLQFFILESRQEALPSSILYAGSTLGAPHRNNVLYIYLPLMKQAILYAFAVGFFISFDELVIATFVLDSPLITVPRRLWSQVDRSMDPSPAVISCLLIIATVSLVVAVQLVNVARRALKALRT